MRLALLAVDTGHVASAKTVDPFGRGAIRPFRRGPNGHFVTGAGPELVQSNVGQVMGVEPGECRWRPSFGGNLGNLRHRGNTPALNELARLTIERAFGRWLPRLRVLGATADPLSPDLPNRLVVSVAYQRGNTAPDVAQAVV